MKTIQVNCELKQPAHHYTALYDYMESYERASHPLDSMWLVKTDKSVPQVRDEVRRLVDDGDEILVFDVTGRRVGVELQRHHDAPAVGRGVVERCREVPAGSAH